VDNTLNYPALDKDTEVYLLTRPKAVTNRTFFYS